MEEREEKLLRKLKLARGKLNGFHYFINRKREELKELRSKRNQMQGYVNDLYAALEDLQQSKPMSK